MKEKPTEDFVLEDTESFQAATNSFREILLRQYSQCHLEGSKEMSSGGIATRFLNGEVVELTLPNQKQIFGNTVLMLRTMLDSAIESNKEIKEKISDINKKYKELRLKNKINLDDPDIKEIREIIIHTDDDEKRERCQNQWNDMIKLTKDKSEELVFNYNQEMLIVLGRLLNKLNYLDEGVYGA